jgi:hypothetical protein
MIELATDKTSQKAVSAITVQSLFGLADNSAE